MQRGRLTQLLGERWAALMSRLQDDPKVAQVMSTRVGLYLRSHPFLALALLLFSAMAALPVGIFFMFAVVTLVMSAVGFVCFELLVLIVGGLTLLSVLSGIALFSLVASVVISFVLVTVPNLIKPRSHNLMTQNQEKQTEGETSGQKM